MRVLSVIPVLGAGGAEVVASMLARDVRAQGHESVLASAGGFRVGALTAAGVRHHRVPLDSRRPRDLLRSVSALRRAFDDRPDLVHAHNVKAAVVARAAFGPSVPVLTTLHGVPASALAHSARLLRASADAVVAVSPYLAAQLEVYGVPAGSVHVVENAVENPVESPVENAVASPAGASSRTRAAVRAALGIAEDEVVVLCAARLAEQKRHDLLVEAWPRVADRAVLLLAGDGPTRGRVRAAVADAGLDGRVRLLGERSDVDRLLGAADLVVLPTDWEGLPISVLEAMAAGVPVVVSRVGGVLETLGEAVRLVAPGSAAALADALAELVDDPHRRATLGARGRELVQRRFAAERMLAGYREQYDALLARRAPVAAPVAAASVSGATPVAARTVTAAPAAPTSGIAR
ncbi:glycosyltransferase [Nocardioides sp. zg-ZUI104]|uniref:glycosyltransferase n=1 Tax=Nocardioides faecalis TaxID=2803858 RepID=UPI001BCCF9FE|nr:glycosyltransferase [Nocardioides faecalis]MBS4753716.1 glycosyltransferase [Nocardioides faecalis]